MRGSFQFLIGRLDTGTDTGKQFAYSKFQFLIGRLDTTIPSIGSAWLLMFQFLIGRLDTAGHLGRAWPGRRVSIPHR